MSNEPNAKQFRDFTDKERAKLAKEGHALPGGGFPITSRKDVENAIHAIGRAGDPAAAKAHIKAEAKRLGCEDLIPETWSVRSAVRLTFASALTIAEAGTEPERRIVDGVEYVVGKPIHIFPSGKWAAVDGREVEFTDADAKFMIDDLATRHADVALTYDHETDKARGSESGGWMPGSKFAFKEDGLWNLEPLWCVDVYETLIKTGKFRYLSGDALGIGSARSGDAFHPRRLLAASLVPKPGFVRGLTGIQLAADESAAIDAWLAPAKEIDMAKMSRAELCQQMGLKASATTDELKNAFSKFMDEEGKEPEHEEKAGAAEHCGCKESKFGEHNADHNEENCDDENCKHHPGAADEDEEDNEDEEEKMGAKNETPDKKLVAEQFAALGKDIAAQALASATTAAKAEVEQRFAADARAKEQESLIADAMRDGRLTTATVDLFRETLGVNHEHGKKLLAALPKPAVAPGEALTSKNAFIMGNGAQVMSREDLKSVFDNPDRDPAKYVAQSKFLTAVARFSANTGIDPASAMASVLRGENEKLEREIFAAGTETAEKYTGETVGQFRASQRQLPVDPELIDFLKKRQSRGDIPKFVVSEEIQQFASITDFQPSARTTLPMALGYFQSEFVGDEALPVFVGGADEKAAWPELAFEKFAAIAQAAGLLGAPTETSLNVIWHTVTLDKYPVRGNIDRRARAASITLPRGIDTIMLENLKSQVGVTKETAQATFLTTNGNFYDSSYYPSVTAWSSAGTPAAYVGLPIEDVYKGMQHVRVGVRAWPDLLLLSPAAAAAMRKNQQIIDTVRYTGTQERPGTGVSNETIAALFRGLFNLTIVVGEAGTASLPSGVPVSDVWGLDAWLLCTGKGKIEAPRFGMTVAAAGSPRVRAFPAEHLGADGADAIVYTDAWQLASISKKAGYRMVGASAAI